ncbi:MAG: DUF4942 domain-containing protein [Loktanella sp.]|nr:DUF4942 domain-containing protein [Loktanella sp.]
MTNENLPATLRKLSEIVDEYDTKRAAIPERLADLGRAEKAIETGATIGGTFTHSIWGRGGRSGSTSERDLEAALLRSAWKHVYDGLHIPKIAPASDRARYDQDLENPPPFTIDNIRANFGKYLMDPREHILRGLAEVFSDLDPAFRSHTKVRIGAKALPKRIILHGFGEYSFSSWGQEKLKDTLNAMASLEGMPHVHAGDISEMTREARKSGEAMWWGGRLKVFRNGNAHLFFDPHALNVVNRGLAEYYGDVLPDTPDENPDQRPGTDLARDLSFYRTPAKIADILLAEAYPRRRDGTITILEPSCGDGAILDAIRRFADGNPQQKISVYAFECDAGRAAEARAKGYPVRVCNFLETVPTPTFDFVLMNPPFYGKHYQKHVEHARRFLKPAGVLYAILPITAAEDHGFVTRPKWGRDGWRDLPVGAFAESGVRINTGIARFFAPDRD